MGLPVRAIEALSAGELAVAGEVAGLALGGYFVTGEARALWALRLRQIAADPRAAHWIARAATTGDTATVVGFAGFHGPPDPAGTAEISYSVDPLHRRQGFARAMLGELLRWAAAEPGVTTVRAAISPDNAGSLATIAGAGFHQVGRQWDEEDGLELLFERPARPSTGSP
ncbi:acetyltransferase (GNAT) family protein [Actinocorallia herbida]|uniref:Acetyltransferase (GNAT) family protein n=1 Tax=Actinocorallia herbida TaxID=58109 RepID=A0A3N1CWC7_9ACTN|nr:GNAT family protein [Actinocorallia herbida]ROO85599.1 acetyltransferase (GNAT) family protein [Actinocorallia herbida]